MSDIGKEVVITAADTDNSLIGKHGVIEQIDLESHESWLEYCVKFGDGRKVWMHSTFCEFVPESGFPTPQFYEDENVCHDTFGPGVVRFKHTDEDVPYYTVEFVSGETINCDGFELEHDNTDIVEYERRSY